MLAAQALWSAYHPELMQTDSQGSCPALDDELREVCQDTDLLFAKAGWIADPWQASLLACTFRYLLILCARQVGKTSVIAAMALRKALLDAGSNILILAPGERQSEEFLRVAKEWYTRLGKPLLGDKYNNSEVTFQNGSRILALPATERTIRGFSRVDLLVLDEASRVPNSLFWAAWPMLTTHTGRCVALSTSFVKLGFFYDAVSNTEQKLTAAGVNWQLIRATAYQCPRKYPLAELEALRVDMPTRSFNTDYLCQFVDIEGAIIDVGYLEAAMQNDLEPLYT